MLSALFSDPYSRLFIVGDGVDWAIDEEAKALEKTVRSLDLDPRRIKRAWLNVSQIIHYSSQFSILDKGIYKTNHRISVDYFHGMPENGESYRKCFEALVSRPEIRRIRVSHSRMEKALIDAGVPGDKIFRIPIGVDLSLFSPVTNERRKVAREKFGIPQDAVVIGSFQKDGVGWSDGNVPKMIKGPDTLLAVIKKLKSEIPDLFILLSGPSRGFVKSGLARLGVPFKHLYMRDYKEVSELYDALDLYLITSREEGGPKAVLESMAKGIPLVTTAVGQSIDIVKNGENAMMAPIGAIEELSDFSLRAIRDLRLRDKLREKGYVTAQENSLENQISLWKEYFAKLTT